MDTWPHSADELRAMYATGAGNRTARRYARFWAVVFGLGLVPGRWVTLEVPGGARPHFPVSMDAPEAEFAPIAARYPVFLVTRPEPGAAG